VPCGHQLWSKLNSSETGTVSAINEQGHHQVLVAYFGDPGENLLDTADAIARVLRSPVGRLGFQAGRLARSGPVLIVPPLCEQAQVSAARAVRLRAGWLMAAVADPLEDRDEVAVESQEPRVVGPDRFLCVGKSRTSPSHGPSGTTTVRITRRSPSKECSMLGRQRFVRFFRSCCAHAAHGVLPGVHFNVLSGSCTGRLPRRTNDLLDIRTSFREALRSW
jgi:hypothetical protein